MTWDPYNAVECSLTKHCIQPQLSSPVEIDDAGKSGVEINTIMIVTTELPNAVSYRIAGFIFPVIEMAVIITNTLISFVSGAEMDDEACFLKTTLREPTGEEKSTFCSTLDSLLSYVLNWDKSAFITEIK
ncbi:hypothetical protein ACTXT7_009811 [Hymenolepis weldensis]